GGGSLGAAVVRRRLDAGATHIAQRIVGLGRAAQLGLAGIRHLAAGQLVGVVAGMAASLAAAVTDGLRRLTPIGRLAAVPARSRVRCIQAAGGQGLDLPRRLLLCKLSTLSTLSTLGVCAESG